MKRDCGGAAAILGAFLAAVSLVLPPPSHPHSLTPPPKHDVYRTLALSCSFCLVIYRMAPSSPPPLPGFLPEPARSLLSGGECCGA